jgi:L-asparaginase
MTMGKRNHAAVLEVHLLREGIVESRHQVEAAVCDERGRILSVAGSSETATFARSALKPFQSLTVIASGVMERFGLSDRDLAIMCSSHKATMPQVRQVFNILWNCDIDQAALQCPVPKEGNSPLQYNCSGKHAGMLAVCQLQHWPLQSYMQQNHPLQQTILNKIADLLKMPAAEFIGAHDDCGVPTYLMEIGQLATLFAQLASGDNLGMERVLRAMTHHPQLIAGPGEFDTELMELTSGELVSKTGAEGVQCVGRVGEGMGLAIKAIDGSKRAKHAVTIHVLRQLGWISPTIAETLSENHLTVSPFVRLDVVGDLSMV